MFVLPAFFACKKRNSPESLQQKPAILADSGSFQTKIDSSIDFLAQKAPIIVADNLIAPYLYWVSPSPPFSTGWHIVIAGIVINSKAHTEIFAGEAVKTYKYILKIERFLHWPRQYIRASFFKSTSKSRIKIGSRVVVFYEKNTENAGTVSMSCSNSEAGILIGSYDDAEYKIIHEMVADTSTEPAAVRKSVLKYISVFCPSYLKDYKSIGSAQ